MHENPTIRWIEIVGLVSVLWVAGSLGVHAERCFSAPINAPLILPGVGAAFLLSFTASFDEFLFALFLGGSQITLPVFMYTQTRFPQTLPAVLALGSCIFIGSAILLGTAEWLRRMGGQTTKSTA